MGFAQRLVSDGVGLGSYYDHDMTRLDGSRTEEDRRIVSLNGLLNQVENHLLDRINLQELYSVLDTTLRGNHVRPLFRQTTSYSVLIGVDLITNKHSLATATAPSFQGDT